MTNELRIDEFIFKEFLLYILYTSEINGGEIEVNGEIIYLNVMDRLTLEGEGDVWETDLKRGVPSISREAKRAILNGKMPSLMKLKIQSGEDSFFFVIDSKTLDIKSLKIPVVAIKEPDIKLEQRMFYIETIYLILESIFKDFCSIRTDEDKWEMFVNDVKKWAKEL
ncbi:conserved hypothetical protein [Thermotomaculum hydrothermale]|uniref:Uncharacterized protein n=1 Tax=Thermotomaculum hydrothermale TaxID=981385 RepID=A0A7R6PEE1_9BACT|nr:hypothetical protein [Thermotomaculum hydrothermale]BBB32209.1 conserved hypothetical protein [Thermotomaculum hydrothermale]